MLASIRRRTPVPVLILSAVTILSACTTPRPRLVDLPAIPPPPAPAECLRTSFEGFAPELAGLPGNYQALTPKARAQTLLHLKASDREAYKTLRAQAIRCAR